ncbi:hypothetical protein C0J52_07606 [Blattella germanica]|nr:hypothetical protein C0J52_07606 [Blattella germanica]
MSGKKTISVKGMKSKSSSELEDQPLKLKDDPYNPYMRNLSTDRSSKLKVELQTLHLSKQSENAMLETIKHIRGSDFSVKDRSSYRDQGENLSRQYWVDRGHLVVQSVIDYSAKRSTDSKTKENMNIYACSKLESYGFYKSHCLEALKLTNGDVGIALEVLSSQYFKLGLSFPFQTTPNNVREEKERRAEDSEILQQREEEKCALQSIYDSSFEERIANRLWVLHLELDYLYEFYRENNDSQSHSKDEDHDIDRLPNRKTRKPQEYCRLVYI